MLMMTVDLGLLSHASPDDVKTIFYTCLGPL